MGLHDDGIARRKRGRRVSAGNGECQQKLLAPNTTTGPKGRSKERMSGLGNGVRLGLAVSMRAVDQEPSSTTSANRRSWLACGPPRLADTSQAEQFPGALSRKVAPPYSPCHGRYGSGTYLFLCLAIFHRRQMPRRRATRRVAHPSRSLNGKLDRSASRSQGLTAEKVAPFSASFPREAHILQSISRVASFSCLSWEADSIAN